MTLSRWAYPAGRAWKLRIQYEGAVYHVMSRGDRRESIFQVDQDRETFLETLSPCCARSGWQVHTLCLLPNHSHLVVETPQPNLVAGMKCDLAPICSGSWGGWDVPTVAKKVCTQAWTHRGFDLR